MTLDLSDLSLEQLRKGKDKLAHARDFLEKPRKTIIGKSAHNRQITQEDVRRYNSSLHPACQETLGFLQRQIINYSNELDRRKKATNSFRRLSDQYAKSIHAQTS